MEREIRYLRDLQHDLERAADREPARERKLGVSGSTGWGARRWIPAVAAVLVVAWGIGAVVENPGSLRVLGGGDEAVPADGGGASDDLADQGAAEVPGAPLPTMVPGVADGGADDGEELRERDLNAWNASTDEEQGALGFAGSATGGGNDGRAVEGSTSFGDLSKIVRTGRMRVKVDDGTFRDARDAAVAVAEDAGGFVLDSRVEGRSGTFTIRVPAARFDAVMTRLGRLGDVELEQQNGDDVTAEYVDLEARTRILTARRDVIQRLMEQATGLSQTLMLANRFDEVQLQLERITGQLRFLNDQIAESTIELELVERTAPQERQEQIDNPSLLEAWKRGIEGFLNVLAVAIIGLGYLLAAARRGRRVVRAPRADEAPPSELSAPLRASCGCGPRKARPAVPLGERSRVVEQPAEGARPFRADRGERRVGAVAAFRRGEPGVGLPPRGLELLFGPERPVRSERRHRPVPLDPLVQDGDLELVVDAGHRLDVPERPQERAERFLAPHAVGDRLRGPRAGDGVQQHALAFVDRRRDALALEPPRRLGASRLGLADPDRLVAELPERPLDRRPPDQRVQHERAIAHLIGRRTAHGTRRSTR